MNYYPWKNDVAWDTSTTESKGLRSGDSRPQNKVLDKKNKQDQVQSTNCKVLGYKTKTWARG